MLRHLPNALTCGNLLSGCVGIVCAFTQPQWPAAWFVWVACVFDFFDGFAARALKTSSPIGKELDSLADMVSFGVLPGILMKNLLTTAGAGDFAWLGLALPVFAALRLAKFNVDTRQTDSFIGVPTPAHALFITGVPYLAALMPQGVFSWPVLGVITIGFCALMVAEIPLFALKFKNFGWADNKIRFTFLIASALLLLFFQAAGIPLAILLYIVLSLGIRA